MEITSTQIKSRHKSITQSESMEVFDLVRMIADQLSRAIDTSIICFLNNVIGGDWRYEDVVLENIPEQGGSGIYLQMSYFPCKKFTQGV